MPEVTDAEMAVVLASIPRTHEAEGNFFHNLNCFPGFGTILPTGEADKPHIRLARYERALAQIRRVDEQPYFTMHKGTPFYMMGWLAYGMKDYEKAAFYMDAALAEDVANHHAWATAPAACFLFLDDQTVDYQGYRPAAQHITTQMRHELNGHLAKFQAVSGISITIDDLVNKFIKPHATDATHRSVVTALLTFLLEGGERQRQLFVRSNHGGTLEPFLTHLFKGGLVFESVLKRFYSGAGNTLGKYLGAAKADLALTQSLYTQAPNPCSLDDLPNLLSDWNGAPFHERAVGITYAIRNTSGHDLGWNDIFSQPTLYESLVGETVTAILWTIYKKFP